MENLYYNGINIIDLAKRRKPQMYSVVSLTFRELHEASEDKLMIKLNWNSFAHRSLKSLNIKVFTVSPLHSTVAVTMCNWTGSSSECQ